MLSLKGVIPVELRGTTYHCPLVLYLPLDYPSKPPIIRILPTPTMQVKPSAYIDAKTKLVSVPYMTDWGKKGEVSPSQPGENPARDGRKPVGGGPGGQC